jgi:hypothetical protein
MPAPDDNHVIMKFGKGIPYDVRCAEMLAVERRLRQASGVRVEVFGETRGDDSKLRAMMTEEQRAKL